MASRLSQRDLAAARALTAALGEAPDERGFRAALIEGMQALVPALMVSYNEIGPGARLVEVTDPPRVITPVLRAAFAHTMHGHPLVSHYQRTGDGQALRLSDVVSRRELERLGVYRHVFRPLGVRHQLVVSLSAEPGAVVGIALSRDARDFGERDRDVLELLRTRLARLRHDAGVRALAQLWRSALERSLDALERGVLVLDREGRIELATPRARDALARHLPVPADASALPHRLAQWARRERTRLRRAGGRGAPEPFVSSGAEGELHARLLPATEPGESDLVLLDERHGAATPAGLAALGLSRRQAEVLALVTRGHTNAQVAELLSLSPRTIQKHLEHVYDALGVRNRAGAVARALGIAGGP